ncbi:MAG TPA: sigma-70 family RNA polymerase sigma factor, partial [Planctomycetota bacterium]|nr:sigma-70 family RNA polymerase sigma factor [Planctomycetota bacterium]
MASSEEQFFQRWCRASDTEALGQLFDFAAPRLFKVAVHLVGDAAAAEDLVQATFLALIEQRASIDASRPVLPWLNGVLAHKAQQLRRERAQPIDAERLHRRAVAEPSSQLEQRELSGELAAAIDRLGEPYRQVVLLRTRHGMAIPEIAHVLERDPGTISVQLHRGLDRLRQLLPAALTSALLGGCFAGRGLGAVKANVLSEASIAVATGWTSILGGVLVGKKIAVLVCVILLALLAYWLLPEAREPDLQARTTPDRAATAAPAPTAAEPAPQQLDARKPLAPSEASLWASQVVDAESGEPLAHADVACFAGRETTPFELQRDHPDYYQVMSSKIAPYTEGDWPMIVGADELALAGHHPLVSLDKPDNGQKPLARTTSDEQGRFSMPSLSSMGLVEVSLAGYRTRWRPIIEGKAPEKVELWREREIFGKVIDHSGDPIAESLELSLFAFSEPSTNVIDTQTDLSTFEEQLKERKGVDIQRVTTVDNGTFNVTFANTKFVHARVLSAGWFVRSITQPDPKRPSMVVQLKRTQVLHFFDAETRQPIERVRLLIRELQNRRAMSCDEIYAPGGLATFPLSDDVFENLSFELTACSAGFEPARWTSTERKQGGVVEVPMRIGGGAILDG